MTARTSDALASALPAWHVAPDADGEPTLWFGDRAIQRRVELAAERRVGTPDERRELNALRDHLWSVLTRALAPDEATLMELDRRVDSYAAVLDDQEQVRWCVEDILAALKGQVSE